MPTSQYLLILQVAQWYKARNHIIWILPLVMWLQKNKLISVKYNKVFYKMKF